MYLPMTWQRHAWWAHPLLLGVVVLVSVGLVSAVGGVTADTGGEPFPGGDLSASAGVPPVRVVYLPDRQVTVSWRVRARGSGAVLRLYRAGLDGGLVLLSERVTELGVRSYQQQDVLDGLAPLSYHLRVVSRSGRETELASLVCVPLRMEPAAAVPSAPWPDAVVLTPSAESLQLVWDWRPAQGGVCSCSGRPKPPTPPPRC